MADTEVFDEDKSRYRLGSCRYNTAESTGENGSTSGPSDHPNNFQYILDVCNDGLLSEAPLAGVNVADNGKMSVITETGDADSRVALETFIVGRRFYDDVELQQGAKITISRDSQNAKDKHAIKVCFQLISCYFRLISKQTPIDIYYRCFLQVLNTRRCLAICLGNWLNICLL